MVAAASRLKCGKIGPELTFGIMMDAASNEPVFTITTAWGGKSLNTECRSPSAGPDVCNESQLANLHEQAKDIEQIKAMSAPAALPEFRGNVIAVPTAPFWSGEVGTIADKHDKVRQMSYSLNSKHKEHPNAEGSMTAGQKRGFLRTCDATLIPPAEAAAWRHGASNAGHHYLGCAKTFALMGRAFAAATLTMMKDQGRR